MANVKIPIEAFEGQDIRLHQAARNKNIAKVVELLSSGVEVNDQDGNGSTALIYASSIGSIEIVSELLKHSANKTIKDNLGYDAYFAAMFHGDFRGVTMHPFDQIRELTKHEE